MPGIELQVLFTDPFADPVGRYWRRGGVFVSWLGRFPVQNSSGRREHETGRANAGGVICAAMEYKGATQTAALQAIEERLRENTGQVLEVVKSQQILPRQAAINLARQRISKAVSYKRWSVF